MKNRLEMMTPVECVSPVMPRFLRHLSLFTRRRRAAKERDRTLAHFYEWQALQNTLPPPPPAGNKLLVIRLDDIGDYVLFRNQLGLYKRSPRWSDYSVTLLGNSAWKGIFAALDEASVDEVIWVDKSTYLTDAVYRMKVWTQLRAQGFSTVIAASRTRPLVLDDLCTLAANAAQNIGSVNTHVHPAWNEVSDTLYQSLFRTANPKVHEFIFNVQFAEWACGIRYDGTRPTIGSSVSAPRSDPYLVCFIGASTRSKRWPTRRWIQFITLFQQRYSYKVLVIGAGNAEVQAAHVIQERTGAESLAGRVSLSEVLDLIAGARAVVTNDTMAAHLGASYNRPTLIIANGVNYARFSEYASAGIDGVATLYPDVFNRKRARIGEFDCRYEDVVTADIESIEASRVLAKLTEILREAATSIAQKSPEPS